MTSSRETQIQVLYEDNHLLALFKPAGILVQGDRTGDLSLLDWAKGWLKVKYEKPGRVFVGLVHRLDRPVPGVVLLARTSKAAARLSEQFRNRLVKKTYWAVIYGQIHPSRGSLGGELVKEGTKSFPAVPGDPRGKTAELTYTVIERKARYSLVEITLITGRHHQIRVQFAAMGHPILGDIKYGAPPQFGAPPGQAPEQGIALLAKRLTCLHPTKGVEMTFESPLPEKWPWPTLK
jgi:23S rRNA pseudouridine1911/1915/1917 synthase